VQFAFRKPDDVRPYQRWFQVPLRFNSPQTAMQFPTYWLDRPSREADLEEYKHLCAAAEAVEEPAVTDRVRRLLRSLIPDSPISGDRIAHSLPMNRRTLNRRLKDRSATFQDILDEIRFEVACQLLRDTDLAAVEIGTMLDYADASAFVRAFRRWSGTTPARWRLESRMGA
jgi:AraC-like DNA-binding protein